MAGGNLSEHSAGDEPLFKVGLNAMLLRLVGFLEDDDGLHVRVARAQSLIGCNHLIDTFFVGLADENAGEIQHGRGVGVDLAETPGQACRGAAKRLHEQPAGWGLDEFCIFVDEALEMIRQLKCRFRNVLFVFDLVHRDQKIRHQ